MLIFVTSSMLVLKFSRAHFTVQYCWIQFVFITNLPAQLGIHIEENSGGLDLYNCKLETDFNIAMRFYRQEY